MAFVKTQKKEFRKELIAASTSYEKKEILKQDLYKNVNGLEWHEHNKEVSINGQFYEVVKIEENKSSAIIYIIKDDKENKLFAGYFAKQKKSNDFMVNMIKLLFSLHYSEDFTNAYSFLKADVEKYRSFNMAEFFSQYNQKIIKPPSFNL